MLFIKFYVLIEILSVEATKSDSEVFMPGAHHLYFEMLETILCNNVAVSYFQANCTLYPFLHCFQKQPGLLTHAHCSTARALHRHPGKASK